MSSEPRLPATIGRYAVRGVLGQGSWATVYAAHENALLRPDGRAVLTDFGIAFDPSAGRLTRTGVVMGTAAYMAPEQVRGEAGPPADVWALGAILYELLCRRTPFQGSSVAIMKQVVSDAVEPPSRHRQGVDPGLEALALACLAQEPAARPLAAEVAKRLFVTPRPPRARGPGPLSWGSVAIVGVGAVAAVAVLAWPAPRPPQVAAPPTAAPVPPPPPVPTEVAVEPAPPPPLVWTAAESDSPPGLEVVEERETFVNPQGFLVMRMNGRSALALRFRAPERLPAETHLRLAHLASIANGEHASWVDISMNGEPVAGRHAPVEGERIEVTPWVRPGDNDLRIVLHREARTAYWLKRLEVQFTPGR